MCSPQAARVALVAAAASPVIASRLPTASATTRAVASVRRLRRPTPAQADLHRPRQEADTPQEPVAGVLAADRGAGRLERLAQVDAGTAPDCGQRGESRAEHADQGRDGEHGQVDAEADVDREEGRAEERGEQIREQDAERDSHQRPHGAEQQRRLEVHERDLPAAGADAPA